MRQKEKLEESKASLAGDTNSSSSSSAFPRPTASTGETSNEKGADEKTEGEKAEKGSTETTAVDNRDLPVDRPIQKSRKRCWTCKTKLELAQRELGACKCGEFNIQTNTVLLASHCPLRCLSHFDGYISEPPLFFGVCVQIFPSCYVVASCK